MSSQGATGKNYTIQGDASNWTQSLKQAKIYSSLNPTRTTNAIVRFDVIQSNQLQTDYRIGAAACPAIPNTNVLPYPPIAVGQPGC